MQTYTGECHCGKVRFQVETALEMLMVCNCSICHKRNGLYHRVPEEMFKLLKGEDDLHLYQFHTRKAKHYNCQNCGIHVFTRPRTAPEFYAINARCLDGTELEGIPVKEIDGRAYD